MNKQEKILLQQLREKSEETELLASVKKAADPIGKLRGKPGFQAEITLRVTHHINGPLGVYPPNPLPANLQRGIAVYLFGLTDFQGGFLRSQTLLPTLNWIVAGAGWIIEPAPSPVGIWDIGDLHVVLGDITGAYFLDIVVHCNNVSYGTFLNSFSSDLIILNNISYSVPIANQNQLHNNLTFAHQSLFGKVVTDAIDPLTYITNQTFQQQVADIPIALPIDKSLMLLTYMNWDCVEMYFNLQVQKVKPLTFH